MRLFSIGKELIIAFVIAFAAIPVQFAVAFDQPRIGIMKGVGNQIGVDVTYGYDLLMIKGQYYYPLLEPGKWKIEKVFQPQINFANFRPVDEVPRWERAFETGLNMGFIGRRPLTDRWGIYLLTGSGPHYVSDTPERQTPGFIFSNYWCIGSHLKVNEELFLDIRPGFRHISNLSFWSPNGGVNNFFISVGLMWEMSR